jgi:hypothetical protein
MVHTSLFGEGSRAYLLDHKGEFLSTEMSDGVGGTTNAPGPTTGVVFTDRGWAGVDARANITSVEKVGGIRFDLVLPNTGERLVVGRIGFAIEGLSEDRGLGDENPPADNPNNVPTDVVLPMHTHGPALSDAAFSASKLLTLPRDAEFSQLEFSEFAGIVMQGQILSVDVLFPKILKTIDGSVWSELFLQTAPHNNSDENGDHPYSQYVVFGSGTRAYLIDHKGDPVDSPMANWLGETTSSPAATAAAVETDHGWAGADMIAYTAEGTHIAGVRFDLVLPDTGEILQIGRVAVQFEGAEEDDNPRAGRPADDSPEPSNDTPPESDPVVVSTPRRLHRILRRSPLRIWVGYRASSASTARGSLVLERHRSAVASDLQG